MEKEEPVRKGERDADPPSLTAQLIILKLTLLVSAPPGVVTTTLPVEAPLGTTAVMNVSLTTLKLVAGIPLKVTLVAPISPWLRRLRSPRPRRARLAMPTAPPACV